MSELVYAFAQTFFAALVRAGVEHVCISPGSRSTPLAVSADRCEGLTCTTHIDERSGAFFALGLAKATRRPVALVCTSGTAAANWLPAVVEAHYARVPLVLLTADRPPELRDWGAGQTIDQLALFGTHVRWFAEVPVPEPWSHGAGGADAAEGRRLRYARTLASRAVAEATSARPGPVHLNWPFREPLEPPHDVAPHRSLAEATPAPRVRRSPVAPAASDVEELVERALVCERGVVACGPLDAGPEVSDAIVALSRAAGWPILADPTSQLRCGRHVADAPIAETMDLVLRDERFASTFAPEFVLRLGATPVSKSFRLWIERHAPEHVWLVDPGGGWEEPSHLATSLVHADPAALCREAADRLRERLGGDDRRTKWRSAISAADRAAQGAITTHCEAESSLLEPQVVRTLAEVLPDGATLYVSNSMPVRDLDAFLPTREQRLRVLSNRGASGIDGMVSSALGAAAGTGAPVVLLTGDLALLHDLGGLLAAHRNGLRLVIVVLNNDGGGIFSFLPIAEQGEAVSFESLFRTSHGLTFEDAARGFGLAHARIDSRESLRVAFEKAWHADRSTILEVPIDRDANVAHFRGAVRAVAEAISHEGQA